VRHRNTWDSPATNATDKPGGFEYPGFDSPIIKTEYDGYAPDEDLASVRGDKSPAPSPSGRYMAFVNDTSGIAKIYIAKPTAAHADSSHTATSPTGNVSRRGMPSELEEDFRVRAHAIIRSWLRGNVAGLVALTGDDADELLPMVTKVLTDALLHLVSREEVERQLDEWFASRPAA
jgi:hypothetical protein